MGNAYCKKTEAGWIEVFSSACVAWVQSALCYSCSHICGTGAKDLCSEEWARNKLRRFLVCLGNVVPSLVLPRGMASGPATLDVYPGTTSCVRPPGTPLSGPVCRAVEGVG